MNEIELARRYLETLLEIERAPRAQVDAYQQGILATLYRHATRNVPLYNGYFEFTAAPDPASPEWRSLPLVSRDDLTRHANSITTPLAAAKPRCSHASANRRQHRHARSRGSFDRGIDCAHCVHIPDVPGMGQKSFASARPAPH
ncbi:MAG: hypothetical protein ACRD3W_32455, partial [Terriglobales bacterium]